MDLAGVCSSRTRFEDDNIKKCGRASGCTSGRRSSSPKCLLLILLVVMMTIFVAGQDDSDDYAADAQDNLVEENGLGAQSPIYDSRSRDFTARCLRLAQYSGQKACEVFMACCSDDNVLNKLNGDRCQRADPSNGCTPNYQGDGIRWSLCRAYNCTEEVTTTTTTTTPSPVATAAASSSQRITLIAFGFAAIYGFLVGFDRLTWLMIVINSVGGLLISLVIKYADNISKAYAQSMAIVGAALGSWLLFNFTPNLMFMVGTGLVIISIYLYSAYPYRTT